MPNELALTVRGGEGALDSFALRVTRVPVVFVNAYMVGEPGGPWTLVDTGLPGSAARIRSAAEARFGAGARPEAIVLTHGHFDHAGNAAELAAGWNVPIYAHPLELPYLTGLSDYAPKDPTVGGAIAFMSRFFPTSGYDFGARVRPLPDDGTVPGMPGWQWLHTPGRTAGHIALFRTADRTLLAGDALATMDLDSWMAQATRAPEFSRPPTPLTPDWTAARASVNRLAALHPRAVGAGHGIPITGGGAAMGLVSFAAGFAPPARGRYAAEPARANERGVISVPPPAPDPFPGQVALGAAALGVLAMARRRR
ncbi:MAG TPA: MBL fold metallo-hydrolase [Longimicrobium sp.]